jgi:hypothetical protein
VESAKIKTEFIEKGRNYKTEVAFMLLTIFIYAVSIAMMYFFNPDSFDAQNVLLVFPLFVFYYLIARKNLTIFRLNLQLNTDAEVACLEAYMNRRFKAIDLKDEPKAENEQYFTTKDGLGRLLGKKFGVNKITYRKEEKLICITGPKEELSYIEPFVRNNEEMKNLRSQLV